MLLLRGLGAATELCSIDSLLPSDDAGVSNSSGVNGNASSQHPLISLEKVSSELESTLQCAEAAGAKIDYSVSIILSCDLFNPLCTDVFVYWF